MLERVGGLSLLCMLIAGVKVILRSLFVTQAMFWAAFFILLKRFFDIR
jgi:hypothetical protein